jgi:hypothetical protein
MKSLGNANDSIWPDATGHCCFTLQNRDIVDLQGNLVLRIDSWACGAFQGRRWSWPGNEEQWYFAQSKGSSAFLWNYCGALYDSNLQRIAVFVPPPRAEIRRRPLTEFLRWVIGLRPRREIVKVRRRHLTEIVFSILRFPSGEEYYVTNNVRKKYLAVRDSNQALVLCVRAVSRFNASSGIRVKRRDPNLHLLIPVAASIWSCFGTDNDWPFACHEEKLIDTPEQITE